LMRDDVRRRARTKPYAGVFKKKAQRYEGEEIGNRAKKVSSQLSGRIFDKEEGKSGNFPPVRGTVPVSRGWGQGHIKKKTGQVGSSVLLGRGLRTGI